MNQIINKINSISLIQKIVIGMIIGAIIATFFPNLKAIGILGSLFVGALKSIAPLLVFFIVLSALSNHKEGSSSNMKDVIILYLLGTFLASLVGVIAGFIFPTKLILTQGVSEISAPDGVISVIQKLLMNIVDNPINALSHANYIGILSWAIIFGVALRKSNENTKKVFIEIADATSKAVKWIINLAPLGIMGLVFSTVSESGLEAFKQYAFLLIVLVGSMLTVAFIVNPIIGFITTRENVLPLTLRCVKESGITAFFTRSSAANIPVNMQLSKDLGLDEDMYSVSIPLGATINMAGAAITITILTLAATHTLGINVDFFTAFILSVLSAISACGASGVAGGSLLLIPVACSLFGIPNDIAMQVVGVGFIIGVIQDSVETALNSSTDVLFTAFAEIKKRKQEGKEYKSILQKI